MRIHNGDFVKIHRTREPLWLRVIHADASIHAT